jgi:hypothetical protein
VDYDYNFSPQHFLKLFWIFIRIKYINFLSFISCIYNDNFYFITNTINNDIIIEELIMTTKDQDIKTVFSSIDTAEYINSQEFIDNVQRCDHQEIKEACIQFGFKYSHDYMKSCGDPNFTDLYPNSIYNILNDNSKYIIIKGNGEGKPPIALVNNNFKENFYELHERYFSKGYYDKNKNCIKAHIVDENILRFGTQDYGYFNIEFEEASIIDLIKQKIYIVSYEHKNYQANLCALGGNLGYETKLAQGDKNLILSNVELKKNIATLLYDNIISNNIKLEGGDKKAIDFIDVIWKDCVKNQINFAFEIEKSKDWNSALGRLSTLRLASPYGDLIKYVIVADEKYYHNVKSKAQKLIYKRDFSSDKLFFLPIDSLINLIKKLLYNNILNNDVYSRNKIFNECLMPINCNSLFN